MPEVIVLNPRARRNRLGRFVKNSRPSRRRRRRRNPIAAVNPRRRRRRRNPIAAANPRRRRRRNPIAAANPRRRRRRRNPIAAVNPRRRRRRQRNPIAARNLFSVRGITNTLMPAAIGGAGALGVDIALSYIPLPEWFQTPLGRFTARLGGALGMGFLASFVVPRRTAMLITTGALTVTAYGSIREFAAQTFPQLPISGISPAPYGDYSDLRLGYIDPAPRLGAYMQRTVPVVNSGVGAYMKDSLDPVNNLGGVTSDGL